MSVAFVREESAEAAQEASLPARAISAHPNLVTQSGLRGLERALAESQQAESRADGRGRQRASSRSGIGRRGTYATSRNASRARFRSLNRLTLR
jgi:hypothetical protein